MAREKAVPPAWPPLKAGDPTGGGMVCNSGPQESHLDDATWGLMVTNAVLFLEADKREQ